MEKHKIKLTDGRIVEAKVGDKIYTSIPVEVKKVDKENKSLEAIFSTQDEDRHGDVVLQDGWDLKNFKKNPVILNSHNYDDAAEVIGRASEIKVEGRKLQGKIIFAVDENPKAKIIFDLYAGGFLSAFSVGFIIKKFKEDKEGNPDYWTIAEAELLEISGVSVPANARALAKKKGINIDKLEKTIIKKSIADGIICMYCDEDITDESKQFQLSTNEPAVVELVCENCFKLKNENNDDDDEIDPDKEDKENIDPFGKENENPEDEDDDGDDNPGDDDRENGDGEDDDKGEGDAGDQDEAGDDEDDGESEGEAEKSYGQKVKKALDSIQEKEKLTLKKTLRIVNSLLKDEGDGLSDEVKEKVKKRKINQVIRGMLSISK